MDLISIAILLIPLAWIVFLLVCALPRIMRETPDSLVDRIVWILVLVFAPAVGFVAWLVSRSTTPTYGTAIGGMRGVQRRPHRPLESLKLSPARAGRASDRRHLLGSAVSHRGNFARSDADGR